MSEIARLTREIAMKSSAEKRKLNGKARDTAQIASWENFMTYYYNAYNEAIINKDKRKPNKTEK